MQWWFDLVLAQTPEFHDDIMMDPQKPHGHLHRTTTAQQSKLPIGPWSFRWPLMALGHHGAHTTSDIQQETWECRKLSTWKLGFLETGEAYFPCGWKNKFWTVHRGLQSPRWSKSSPTWVFECLSEDFVKKPISSKQETNTDSCLHRKAKTPIFAQRQGPAVERQRPELEGAAPGSDRIKIDSISIV